LIDRDLARRTHPNPSGLGVQHLEQFVVVLVKKNWRAGDGFKFHRSTDVVDVSVGDDDLLDL
jgi:hypothetical protein